MNHQPFETWILSGEPLSQAERQALEAHLRTCQACREMATALRSVETVFRETPAPQPAAGFSLRWQARLEAHRRRAARRQAWLFLLLNLAGMLSVAGMLLAGLFFLFDSPLAWLIAFSRQMAVALSALSALSGVLRTVASLLPPAWWLGVLEASALLVLLWFFSLRKLVLTRRVSA